MLKRPSPILLLIPFFKYQKKHTYKSSNDQAKIFSFTLFHILKIVYLQILKIPSSNVFSYSLFQILEKSIVTNIKKT